MSISEIKKEARQSLTTNWGKSVFVVIIFFAIQMLLVNGVTIAIYGGFEEWQDPYNTSIGAELYGLIMSILLTPLSIAFSWFFLDITRDKAGSIRKLFSIYTKPGKCVKLFLTALLEGIYIFLWSLLLIIPGIIKTLSYSQTYYILKDHPELSPNEAITASKNRMQGKKGKYFLLNLSFIGWMFLSILTLGIGFLWLAPYMSTSLATFYEEEIADNLE